MSIYSPKSLKMSKDLSYRIAKRTMDVGLSLLIGFLLIPLFLLLICLVLIIDGKPVFFSSEASRATQPHIYDDQVQNHVERQSYDSYCV